MEGFQANENTSVEWKTKGSLFEIRQEIREAKRRKWDNFLFTDECPKYYFQYPDTKNDVEWGSQKCGVPPAF